MSASTTQARRGIRGERLTVLTVLLGMLLSLVAVLATPHPAFADGSSGTESSNASHTTCKDAGFGTNKVNTASDGAGSTGNSWGDIVRTSEKVATATINEGWTVDICIKIGGGSSDSVFVYTGASCDSGEADDGVACEVEYDFSSVQGGGVSHVSWGNPVQQQPELDLCDPSDRPDGMSIDEWLSAEETQSEGEFDRSDCFDIEITNTCGSFTATVTHDTGYDYRFRWVEGDTKAVNPDTDGEDGDNAMPAEFAEDYSDGEVQLTYYIVGPEKDYLVGTDIPNWWDGGATTTVDTDCTDPDPVAAVASLSVGECVFDGDEGSSTYPATYSLTVNDGTGPFTLFVDGEEDTTVTLTDGSDQSLGDFAPGTELEIQDGNGLVVASDTVLEGTCVPDPAVLPTALEKDPAPEPEPEPEPAPEVESAAEELPATGLDREGLLPLSLLLIAMGAAILWLDRPWVGVR